MEMRCPKKTRILPTIPITTVTVNDTEQTSVHVDDGDLQDAWSFLTLLQKGRITGGHFILTEWSVALQLAPGDILLTKTARWKYGNAPITCSDPYPASKRIALVGYINDAVVNNSNALFV